MVSEDEQQNVISLNLTNRPKVVKREKGKWRLQDGILKKKKKKKKNFEMQNDIFEKKIEIEEKDKKKKSSGNNKKKHPEHS